MWILFPNQLFSQEQLATIPYWKKETYVLWEDPLFYGIRPDSKASKGSLKLNQLRIVYQKWLWLNYIDYLKSLHLSIQIIPFEELSSSTTSLKKIKTLIASSSSPIQCFDPEDAVLKLHWRSLPIEWKDSPMFLTTQAQLEEYMRLTASNKQMQHRHFYQYVKNTVLKRMFPSVNIPDSKDSENRKPIPNDFKLPELPYNSTSISTSLPKNLQLAFEWSQRHFPKNPGPTNLLETVQRYLVQLPSNVSQAESWWKKYRQTRFSLFGPYEDAMVSSQPILFHSFSAMLLNFGLLTPAFILQDLLYHYQFNKGGKEQNASLEGFIRQVAGLREYSRLYYRKVSPNIYHQNPFEQKGKLTKEWYSTTVRSSNTNSLPPLVQEAIHDAWNTGYLHHIRRLMVVSNYMNLNGIHPMNVYKWMYEFSLDSWEWVMVFNVYSMGTWSDKGYAMRKPYISSPNYLLKMSDTPSGPWVASWKSHYDAFLKNHSSILKHTIYAYQLK